MQEALPAEMDLLLDANCSYSVAEGCRLAARLRDIPIGWLEEPVEKGDFEGHSTLRNAVDVPIATGENLYSAAQFGRAVAADAADVLQPDVCGVGVSTWLAVAGLARAVNLPISRHYVEPLHAHLAAAAGDVPYLEHHSTSPTGCSPTRRRRTTAASDRPRHQVTGCSSRGLDAHEKPFGTGD